MNVGDTSTIEGWPLTGGTARGSVSGELPTGGGGETTISSLRDVRADNFNITLAAPSEKSWSLVFRDGVNWVELCPECGVHGVTEAEEWEGQVKKRRVGRECHWCGWRGPCEEAESKGGG